MRHEDWPKRLAQFLRERRETPFAWASHDCATFARDWIEVATGRRVFEVPYTDVLSAARFIADQGGMRLAATAVLGDPLEHPQGAGPGDVALVLLQDRECLCVVDGEFVWGPAEAGLMAAPRAAILAAWRV